MNNLNLTSALFLIKWNRVITVIPITWFLLVFSSVADAGGAVGPSERVAHVLLSKTLEKQQLPNLIPRRINASGSSQAIRASFQTVETSSKSKSATPVKRIRDTLKRWNRESKVKIENIDELNLPTENKSLLKRALERNSAYTDTMQKMFDENRSEMFFSETYLDNNRDRKLVIGMSSKEGKLLKVELIASEPDNLVKVYTNSAGGIKGSGAENRIRMIDRFRHKMEQEHGKHVKWKVTSTPESEKTLRDIKALGFKACT